MFYPSELLSRSRGVWATLIPSFLIALAGCSQNVTVPPTVQDHPPQITWNVFIIQQPSGYSGDVEPGKSNVKTTSSVNVTQGAHVQFSGSATNAGGVQQFHVKVQQNSQTLADVVVTGTKDANGQAPNLLSILGSNGAGGSGGQPIVAIMSKPVIVTASATNFNGMNQTITITYNPATLDIVGQAGGSGQPPPTTAQLFIVLNHDLGPYQITTAPPDFCQANLTWTLTPGALNGSSGSGAPYSKTVTANPAPSWTSDTSGLYTAHCGYGQMVGSLRPGNWTIGVSGTGAGGSTQAQCQATLATGMNGRTFRWGQASCQ